MDVRMPDGTIITNVPDNITQSELLARYGKFGQPQAETQNPFKGALGRLSGLTASGIEAVAEVAERTGDYLESKIPLSNIPESQIKSEKQLKPLFDLASSLRNIEKDIGYQPSTKLGDLADNPATAIPFIAERIVTSTPDMAAAVLAFPAYVGARTKEILDERVKNDNKTLDDATVGDVAAATGAAIAEASIERFATKRLGKGTEATTTGRRVAKETGVQSGTEAIEEGAAYLGETAGTVKGVDTKEMGERMLEGAIVGGGLGAGVQGAREVFGKKEAPPAEEVAAPKPEPVVTQKTVLDESNKPVNLEIVEDPVSGDVIAKTPDGEEIDLTNMLSAGLTLDEAIELTVGLPPAPEPARAVEAAAPPAVAEEPVLEEAPPEIPAKTVIPPSEPLPESDEIARLRAESEGVAKEMRRVERKEKGPSLATALRNRLDSREVFDISPEPGVASWFGRPEKRGPGERLGNIISSGELNDFLRPDLVINPDDDADVIAQKEPEAEEYIKEKIRNKNYLTFETDTRLQNLGTDFSELQNLLDREITDEQIRAEANEIAAEIAREEGLSPLEAAPEEGPIGDLGERPVEPREPEEGIKFRQVAPKLINEQTGATITNPFLNAVADRGYKMLPLNDPKTYKDRGGKPFRTFEKDGVRVSFQTQAQIYSDPDKPSQNPTVYFGNEDDVVFQHMFVDKPQRRKGLARKALQDIVDIADQNNFNVYLEPVQLEKAGATKKDLEKLYAQFGFVGTDPNNRVMKRTPSAVPALELKAETAEETVARQEREAKERPAREAKAIADREREVFRLEPTEAPVAPPVQQKLFDVSAKTAEPIVLEGDVTPSFTREFDRVAKILSQGRMTPEAFAGRVLNLRQEVLNAKKARERPARVRGADFIRQKLLEAKRNNVIDAETLELTEWFIKQNPALVDDLGISIRQSDEVGTAGQYIPTQRIAKLIKGSIEKTTPIHEILHHLERMMPEKVQNAIQKSWLKSMGEAARKAAKDGNKNLQEFYDLILEHHATGSTKPFEQAVKMVANGKVSYDHYQHVNPSEFWAVNASRIMSGRFDIRGDKLGALKTWLRGFTEKIKDIFGLKSDAAIIRALDSLIKGDGEFVTTEMLAEAPVFKSVFNKKQPKPEPTSAGREALASMDKLGRQEKSDPQSMLAKAKQGWDNAVDNPKFTASESAQAFTRFTDYVETKVFSSDAAANNAYQREIRKTLDDNKEIIGKLLSVSSSQASHPDALANLFIRYGKLEYNPELYKYEAKEDKVNFVALAKQIDEIATKYGLTKEEAERIAHTSFEATRLQTLVDFNEKLKDKVAAQRKLAREGSTETIRNNAANEARRLAKQFKYIHAMYIPDGVELDRKQTNALAMEQIKEGLALKTKIPELQNLVDTWNGIRQNSVKELVDSGLWTKEEAEEMLSNVEYVPFYREEQLEKNKGPKEFLRNLQVQAKEKRLKGSQKAVADIFDNMARWTQYAVKRSVLNRLAVAKADALVEADLARKVDKKIVGKNIVSVWRNGEQEFYEVDDPLFMDAFTGLESVAIPALRPFAAVSNFLRQTVVLYPLFSVSQVPQDAFAAMFTSGLKTRFALRIPALAAKEFLKTLTKRSQTHRELERFGAVGVRDFTAAVARNDAEIYAGLKGPPGFWGKTKNLLEHISMASDNAVRQAVYEASMQQGVSRAEALEKAFQLINFRAKGSSKIIAAMGQVIPFFNAYLAAQHVAIKTITGRGISPMERKEALKTLAATTGSVMVLSMIYAMLMGDDEDYENKPSVMRDRVFMVPGTKITIPIRQDIFSIPKIVSEHTYLLLADNGSTDGRKFRDSIRAALANALFSPTVVPQAIKPIAEVAINYNFFQGRPLVGTYQKGLDVERQFTDSTSQLGKLLGGTGLISPIAVDHLVRGMFGSVGGLTLYLTNFVLHDPSIPKPEMSAYEMLTALPGTSGFLTKENETGLKNDFYVLRDEVAKIANTINDIEARNPEALEKYFSESKTWSQWIKLEKAVTPEAKMIRADLKRDIDRITKDLSEIRREISMISNLTDKQMSAKEKGELIKDLRKAELEMMKSIDVRSLRALADL